MKYLNLLPALILSACTTVYSAPSFVTDTSSIMQEEDLVLLKIDNAIGDRSESNFTSGWNFDEDNGKSRYFSMNVVLPIYRYAQAKVNHLSRDLGQLEELIVNTHHKTQIDTRNDSLDFWECYLNQYYFVSPFPNVKDLKRAATLRITQPSSKSRFFVLYDAGEKGVLWFDIEGKIWTESEDVFDTYEDLFSEYKSRAFSTELDIKELQEEFVKKVYRETEGKIKLKFFRWRF
jgi:hypothetical protein